MWFVDNLGIRHSSGAIKHMKYAYFPENRPEDYSLEVVLRSDNDERVILKCLDRDFAGKVLMYNPYGLSFVEDGTWEPKTRDMLFMRVDVASWQFLRLVDNIKLVSSSSDKVLKELRPNMRELSNSPTYRALDNEQTLFMCTSLFHSIPEYETLLKALSNAPELWTDKSAFLFSSHLAGTSTAYRVQFTDIDAAKSAMTKYRVLKKG